MEKRVGERELSPESPETLQQLRLEKSAEEAGTEQSERWRGASSGGVTESTEGTHPGVS